MTEKEFQQLVELVTTTGLEAPRALFCRGFADWYTRTALAKFLCHPAYARYEDAVRLLMSVTDVQVSTPEDIEHKAWALKMLCLTLRKAPENLAAALFYIDEAISLAESTDRAYRTILRGDLWAERWIVLHELGETSLAVEEADQKIDRYASPFAKNNSYLFNAYRFKAQVAAARRDTAETLALLKTATATLALETHEKRNLAAALSARHHNPFVLINGVDRAIPGEIEWIL